MIKARLWAGAGLAVFLVHAPDGARAQKRDYLVGALALFNVSDFEDETAEGRIEFASGLRVLDFQVLEPYLEGIGPFVALMANLDGGVFGYGGIFADIRVGRVVARPQVGIGGWKQGGSQDLGGVFQFHAGIDVSYRFDNGHRLGAMFAHISNGGIHDSNPGNDSVLVTYAIPFDALI